MMNIRDYMTQHGISQKALAERIGTSQAHVCRLASGALPSLQLAIRIEEVTEGHVPVGSWRKSSSSEAA